MQLHVCWPIPRHIYIISHPVSRIFFFTNMILCFWIWWKLEKLKARGVWSCQPVRHCVQANHFIVIQYSSAGLIVMRPWSWFASQSPSQRAENSSPELWSLRWKVKPLSSPHTLSFLPRSLLTSCRSILTQLLALCPSKTVAVCAPACLSVPLLFRAIPFRIFFWNR